MALTCVTPEIERECHGCGLFQTVPALPSGAIAGCIRCDTVLRRGRARPLQRPAVFSLSALFLFLLAASLPFMTVSAAGRSNMNTLLTGPEQLEMTGYPPLALAVLAFSAAIPLAKILTMLLVLFGVRTPVPPRWLPRVWAWVEALSPWAMIEVFLLGVFVAYTRLTALATVEIGPGLICLVFCMLAMVSADAALDREAVWEAMEARGLVAVDTPPSGPERLGCDTCRLVSRSASGQPCPRCGARLRRRKPNSLARTTSMLLTGAILYIPANVYPVLNLKQLGQGGPSTIIGGVVELVHANEYPLALLVFFASITVPVLKLVSLSYMLWATHKGSGSHLKFRTKLYRTVDFIGRWSMIDVFMISILTALVRLGFLATVTPEVGAVAFAAVVVVTMFAAGAFDPRVMWDAAGEVADAGPEAEAQAAPA